MYLMAGAGTNVPELLTITKMIGKKAAFMYFSMVAVLGFASGYITNKLLMPDFKPMLDFNKTTNTIEMVNTMIVEIPAWGQYACSFVVIGFAMVALYRYLKRKFKKA